jgi:hypothetical protein
MEINLNSPQNKSINPSEYEFIQTNQNHNKFFFPKLLNLNNVDFKIWSSFFGQNTRLIYNIFFN